MFYHAYANFDRSCRFGSYHGELGNIDVVDRTTRGRSAHVEEPPDVHLKKQAEQGARVAPARHFAGIPSVEITGAVEVLAYPIPQLRNWSLFSRKKQREQPWEHRVCVVTGAWAAQRETGWVEILTH